jgi:hypothetical protein
VIAITDAKCEVDIIDVLFHGRILLGRRMGDDRSADAGPPSPMKVRELLARLQDADPDFVIVIDAASQSLLILNPKPGFCDPAEIEEYETSCLTQQDLELLRDMHIKQ